MNRKPPPITEDATPGTWILFFVLIGSAIALAVILERMSA